MKKTKYITALGISFFILGFTFLRSDAKIFFKKVASSEHFSAGSPISLTFMSNAANEKPQLFILHSYGKTVLEATVQGKSYLFTIPKNFCDKTGIVSWYLLLENKTIQQGDFEIEPNDKLKTILENYSGPRTILAGGEEFTMIVTIPTDAYDNPKKDQTNVIVKHQFLENIQTVTLKTNYFITWYNIYSPTKSGKLLVSSECDKIATKEIETEIYPNIPTDFKINYSRNHAFADGNHFTKFSTSILKDEFKNTISDGTMVTFIIKTKNDYVLKTFGATIDGIASATLLHPDHAEKYSVQGFVTGIAQSNVLTIPYYPVTTNFTYQFTNHNRTINVGPLKSFMNQLIPDGIKVELKIFTNHKLLVTLQEETSNGMATFELIEEFFDQKKYRFEITTMGITKKTKTLNYENHK